MRKNKTITRKDFLRKTGTGKEPLINAEHALHVLEVIEAARKSGATGKRIKLQSTFKWPVV
ncbi:MAG TPA: hypothetical protein VJ203_00955 [Bacteroidales bacterium]|nr:hypothetical protein [Bacteroidales bacterium]